MMPLLLTRPDHPRWTRLLQQVLRLMRPPRFEDHQLLWKLLEGCWVLLLRGTSGDAGTLEGYSTAGGCHQVLSRWRSQAHAAEVEGTCHEERVHWAHAHWAEAVKHWLPGWLETSLKALRLQLRASVGSSAELLPTEGVMRPNGN